MSLCLAIGASLSSSVSASPCHLTQDMPWYLATTRTPRTLLYGPGVTISIQRVQYEEH
ncbi:unnamed protein product [Camellia sinensis]